MINMLFQLIGDLFSPENIGKFADVGIQFADMGITTAKGLVKAIGTAFTGIDVGTIAQNMSGGIQTFLTKIGDWLSEQIKLNESGDSLIGDLAVTVSTIATNILTGIGEGIQSLASSGVVGTVATNLAGFFTSSFSNLAGKITSGEIDLEGIATAIGTGIGNLIKIGADFVGKFVTDFKDWYHGGGKEQLVEVGTMIIDAIKSGLEALGDVALKAVLGEDIYNFLSTLSGLSGNKKGLLNPETGKDVTAEEYLTMSDEQKAAAETYTAQHKGEDFASFAAAMSAKYGINYDNDYEAGAGFVRYGLRDELSDPWGFARPWTWGSEESKKKGLYRNLVNQYVEGLDNASYGKDRTAYAQNMAGLSWLVNTIKANGTSLPYEELLKGAANAANGATIDIPVAADTSPAEGQFNALKSKMEKGIEVPYRLVGGGGGTDTMQQQALGGRFSTATRGEFGEDGTEYIIPITKPARAKALILQMLQEMGAGASDILSEWGATGSSGAGVGGPGAGWSSQPAAMYPSTGGSMKSNSDNNVNVPTTINVYGSGDALMAGQAAARASQSNVLRAVRGVVSA